MILTKNNTLQRIEVILRLTAKDSATEKGYDPFSVKVVAPASEKFFRPWKMDSGKTEGFPEG